MSKILYGVFLILPLIVFMAAAFDLYTYTIPNSLSVVLIFGFYLYAFINPNMTIEQILIHSLVGFGALVACFMLFCVGAFGGGDAKILAASSLWLGFDDILPYFFYVSLAGGGLSLFVLVLRNYPFSPVILKFEWLRSLYFGKEHKRSVPYAIAIAMGLYVYLPHAQIFHLSAVS